MRGKSFSFQYLALRPEVLQAIMANISLVSPDLSAAITFGIVNIFTSLVTVLIAYLTLRYMVLTNSMLLFHFILFCTSILLPLYPYMNQSPFLSCSPNG
jgi:hypothetical protein